MSHLSKNELKWASGASERPENIMIAEVEKMTRKLSKEVAEESCG